jgi:hypothetical protein
MSDALDSEIRENAAGPRSAQVDGVQVEQHSIEDQIAADRYLASRKAAKRPLAAIRRTRAVPPGA